MTEEANKRYRQKHKAKISAKRSKLYWNFKEQYGVSYYAYRKNLRQMSQSELMKITFKILDQLNSRGAV